jgi:hypothetical protein
MVFILEIYNNGNFMKKFIITTDIKEEIIARDEEEAKQKFFEEIESEPQQNINSFFEDRIRVRAEAAAIDKKESDLDEVYADKYIKMIKKLFSENESAALSSIINKVYQDGFEDGVNNEIDARERDNVRQGRVNV